MSSVDQESLPRIQAPGNVAERLHRSPAGPMLRTVASSLASLKWSRSGRQPPAPPHLKRKMVSDHIARFRPHSFIETGTYRGDTLAMAAKMVSRSYSIELDESLCALARHRFRHQADVEILWGDSAAVLPELLESVERPAVVWLDGHYSGGVTAGEGNVPIWSELNAALSSEVGHLVLIDDARLFNGTDGYPTIDALMQTISAHRQDESVRIVDDIISIEP